MSSKNMLSEHYCFIYVMYITTNAPSLFGFGMYSLNNLVYLNNSTVGCSVTSCIYCHISKSTLNHKLW